MSELLTKEVHKSVEKLIEEFGIKNYTIDLKPGTVTGENFLGVITNVIVYGLDQDGNKKKLNLIVKTSQQNDEFRDLIHVHEVFEREIYMYTKFFPLLTNFQKEKRILKPLNAFAKLHKHSLEDKSESLIMENMKAIGYKLHNRQKTLDYNHCCLVLREYGKLHALSFALRDQKPKVFQKLVDECQENFFCKLVNDEMLTSFHLACDKAMESLNPESDKAEIQKFKNFRNNGWDLILNLITQDAAEPYAVVAHGDCWMNNILFKYDNTDVPTKICLLDWQLSRTCSPVLDISYFTFTCTDKEFRDKYYDTLMEEYYESFSTFLRELGSDPDKLFPFEVFQKHLEKFSVFGMHMALTVVKLMLTDTEESYDFSKMTQDERINVYNDDFKNVDKYFNRARGIIVDCCRLNYL